MRNIRQNLVFAFLYNSLGIPIAAGALYPAVGVTLSPIIAAAAMAMSSLSVVANANRLRRFTPKPIPDAAATTAVVPAVGLGGTAESRNHQTPRADKTMFGKKKTT